MFGLLIAELESTAVFAIAAAVAIGIAVIGGTIAMGLAIYKAIDATARQPEADGKIKSTMILGLVFIETLVIYALVIAILLAINVLG